MSRDHIGDMETTLGRIMGSRNQTFTSNLFSKNGNTTGKITISAQKVTTDNRMVKFDCSIQGLPSQRYWLFFGNDDPFFYIERSKTPDSDEFIRIYESDPVYNTVDPKWSKQILSAKRLCNGEPNNRLRFIIFSFSSQGYHTPYGEFICTLQEILDGKTEFDIKKMDSVEYLSCQFRFLNFKCEHRPSFYDFLQSGWEMNLT